MRSAAAGEAAETQFLLINILISNEYRVYFSLFLSCLNKYVFILYEKFFLTSNTFLRCHFFKF